MITLTTLPASTTPITIAELGNVVINPHPSSLILDSDFGFSIDEVLSSVQVKNNILNGKLVLTDGNTTYNSSNIGGVSGNNTRYSDRVILNKTTVKTSDWKKISEFIFPGTSNLSNFLPLVKAIVWQDGTGTSNLRIYDFTNRTTICEASFTNVLQQILTINTFVNSFPANESILEIQAKTESGANISFLQIGGL